MIPGWFVFICFAVMAGLIYLPIPSRGAKFQESFGGWLLTDLILGFFASGVFFAYVTGNGKGLVAPIFFTIGLTIYHSMWWHYSSPDQVTRRLAQERSEKEYIQKEAARKTQKENEQREAARKATALEAIRLGEDGITNIALKLIAEFRNSRP